MASIWIPFTPFPSRQRAWIYAQFPRQVFLPNPGQAAQCNDVLTNSVLIGRKRYASKKFDDFWDEVKSWRRAPFLPVGHRVSCYAEALGHILLQKTQVETPLAEVVADSPQLPWIGWW